MARGWESKSVESQIESAERRPAAQPPKSDKNTRERQGLLLSRAYVLHQIESSSNERYTASLRKALADLDRKLAQLDGH
jgi:hypothetical protein